MLKKIVVILTEWKNCEHEIETDIVTELQEMIVENETELQQEVIDLLDNFVYDLAFYESDDKMRKEDYSYYGKERLLQYIDEFLEKLKKYYPDNK